MSNDKAAAPANLRYVQYDPSKEEFYTAAIRQLISKDLSEPYSIYVYRYFLYTWGHLCYMSLDDADNLMGVVVCKLEPHHNGPLRGYIAMLATKEEYRGKGIGTKLVRMAIDAMNAEDADEIVLETEVTNTASLRVYERLGFLRSKRLHRYYLDGNTAFRLVLYLKDPAEWQSRAGLMQDPPSA
ncbi:acyl-CoA N-acyltransferase [Cryomyces antarcticus]|uniref:N-acetyltransferase domain-containing protein n=1 Tax=Cryomyces antarcticus TaxID=329879 RepID=A0ABR0LMF8_9PEZI|nr:hypothetical protein LTR60_005184 [Cryomyces antarcticus]KAK5010043.1 hypothetical protein LTR39_004803 [Cryomyces antarcticus]KAK5141743.1 hypothetical protein LTR04_002484 [Oleoguttula sp. CCFEE 6159]KAK5200661.1 hypothetical protein LTR16_005346 [Cryomyces antarcticus]